MSKYKRLIKELQEIQPEKLVSIITDKNANKLEIPNSDYIAQYRIIEIIANYNKAHIAEIKEIQQQKLYKNGLHIVTCGSCSEPFIVEPAEEIHTCPFCEYSDDRSTFPDLFH